MRLWDKYRPKGLQDMVGQPCLRALRDFAAAPYPCCLLFEGPPGTGKTAAAIALAADVGCTDDWSGLHVVPSVNLSADACRELFERTLRLIPMAGKGWHVLVIEELEACSSATVTRYLKVALDTSLPPRCIVVATSNDTGSLDPALVQRFESFVFDAGETFATAAVARLHQIWATESNGAPIQGNMRLWGFNSDGQFSMRSALKTMQQHLNLIDRRVSPV